MPFRSHSNHTCTYARFPRTDDAVACVVVRQGWERTSRPVNVSKSLSNLRMNIPVRRVAAQHCSVADPGLGRDVGMVQAYCVEVGNHPRPGRAAGEGACSHRDPGVDSLDACSDLEGHTASREDRLGWPAKSRDLLAHQG